MKTPEEVLGHFLSIIGDSNIAEEIIAVSAIISAENDESESKNHRERLS